MDATGGQIAIYSRKSRFTGKGESIENQIGLCRQYIHAHFAGVADAAIPVYEDEGFSGKNTDRPRFQQMMRDARAGRFSAIVCYRLDRISRNIGDFARLIDELARLQVAFVSIREQFDTSSPMGRAMMYIASVFSQLERETIAERIRDNMRELAKTGRWLGGVTPTGYSSEAVEKVTVDGRVRKACRLKIIPEEAELVRLIFRTFRQTGSLTQTETYLMQHGLRTKNGRYFSRFAIKNILENPVYLIADADALAYFQRQGADLSAQGGPFDGGHGVMAYNKTVQEHGKANRVRGMSEWIVTVGRHKGLIRGAEWVEAQSLLEQNRSKAFRKPRSGTALLSGILICGGCGSFMRPKLSRRRNAQGELIYSYLCELKEKSRGQLCHMANGSGNQIDQAVWGEIRRLRPDARALRSLLAGSRQAMPAESEKSAGERERLQQALAENDREIAALVTALAKSTDTAAGNYITRRIDRLDEEGRAIRRRIGEAESPARDANLSASQFAALQRELSSFGETFDGMPLERKRAALRKLVGKAVWDGENVHIWLPGSEKEREPFPPSADGR